MNTCRIGCQSGDDRSVRSVLATFDGTPETMLALLETFDREKVTELVAHAGLGLTDTNRPLPVLTPDSGATDKRASEFILRAFHTDCDYVYLYRLDGTWDMWAHENMFRAGLEEAHANEPPYPIAGEDAAEYEARIRELQAGDEPWDMDTLGWDTATLTID